uniref:Uncharacterized protein n=1 Tax=Sinocyclocheilus grahami TaxID=75366 RepID=A0A672TEK5_SINGR
QIQFNVKMRFHRSTSPKAENTTEGFTPAHEENVRFVYEGEFSNVESLTIENLRRAKVGASSCHDLNGL